MDLQIAWVAAEQSNKSGLISSTDSKRQREGILAEWQNRWDATPKGEWTKITIPDIKTRYILPLKMDHYTSQILTGHGNFIAK